MFATGSLRSRTACKKTLTRVAAAEEQDLCHGESVRVRDGHERRNGAERFEAARSAAMELKLRGAASPDNLNPAPQDFGSVSGPERFHGRLFSGESSGKMNRGDTPPGAVRNFSFCEHPAEKSIAIPLNSPRDPRNVGGIESQADDV